MEQELKSFDVDQYIGEITLSDGQTVLGIPKLSVLKLIKIVKFFGIDGSKIYSQFQDVIQDPDIDDTLKLATILESLDERQLVKVFSILLDMKEEDVLKLDLNEMLEVILVYAEKLDIEKTFLQIRTLAKKLFGKELPETFGEWIEQRREAAQEAREEQIKRLEEIAKKNQPEKAGTNS